MKEEENEFNQKPAEPHRAYKRRIIEVEEALLAKFKEDIANNKPIQDYIKKFQAKSIESFFTRYLRKKVSAYRFSDWHHRKIEEYEMQWVDRAENHLIVIQQKKLFDMQCLWRAEKVEIKEVDICNDFELWANHVLDCPFIDPITEEDIELYKKYLSQENTDGSIGYLDEWQQYDSIIKKGENEDDSNVPEWYEFYNTYKGTSALMLLPNIRGKKEREYIEMALNDRHARVAEVKKTTIIETPTDKRPRFNDYDESKMQKFIEEFEDKETKKNFKTLYVSHNRMLKNQDTEKYFKVLKEADEPIKFEEADDWKTALILTVEKYQLKKGFEFLPVAFEHYKLKEITGNQIDIREVSEKGNTINKALRKLVLDGREMKGEPRNFDF